MKIAQVEIFALKIDYHYGIGGHQDTPGRLPGTDYYIEPQWPHAYSRLAESCIIKLTTECGLAGWGEASAPLVPETPASILANLVGPALIGQNPLSHEAIYERLFHLMDVRGHTSGFMMDAIAAADIAVWDLRGRHYGAPVSELLGGPLRARLSAYVSGLRQPTW
ncbi:MAG: mandelate racemase/muconate lactonizing enzyme family protein, partial [Planctomycetota bacterium]|nr:mandelate racemase/muconate lactonizing enzyme family protein [Planctomycetota bacterium]